ncbi:predicted protein [Chaetoceros tenuissimus]|uniref:Uncharacterized protein n=1 Tax=Chaetoceros tenuissimus TaxID=426638 RepID=A0AAD3HC95_9STRA|nr:predicted protein [Chaetoceros tenuissimus]
MNHWLENLESTSINDLLDCASIHSIDFSIDGQEQQELLPPASPSWFTPNVSQEIHLTEQVAPFLPQNQSEIIFTMEKYKVHLGRLEECINQSKRTRAQVSVVKEHMKKRAKKNILAAMGIRSELTEGSRKKLILQSRINKTYNTASDASASTGNDSRRVNMSSNFSSNLSKGY